jgi:hypothetical protein
MSELRCCNSGAVIAQAMGTTSGQQTQTMLEQEANECDVQEITKLKQSVGAQENECSRLQQLLDIERDSNSQAKDELQALRAETKGLAAQRARDSATVMAAEDLRKQWENVQVWHELTLQVFAPTTPMCPVTCVLVLLAICGACSLSCGAGHVRHVLARRTSEQRCKMCSWSAMLLRVPWWHATLNVSTSRLTTSATRVSGTAGSATW